MPEARRLRVLWLMALALLLTLVLQGRLIYWQVGHHRELWAQAHAQHEQRVQLPAARGRLVDRNGLVLASNTPVYSIFATPDQIGERAKPKVVETLAPLLQMSEQEIRSRLDSTVKFVYLKKRVPAAVAARLDALHLEGIGKLRENQRAYMAGATPGTTLAHQLLGFVNDGGRGQYGVEGFYDEQLRGRAGFESTLRDLTGRPIILSDHVRVAPVDGAELTLTLDSQLQYFVEQALAAGVKRTEAEGGSALVIQPRTGEILAWASSGGYDANAFRTTDPARFADPILAHLYEPGSVMKVITLAGALDTGAISPLTPFSDSGWVRVGGITVWDWDRRPHPNGNMTSVLEQSLNVGAVKVEQLQGKENFLHYLHAFGFGALTGVDVAGEVTPALNRPDWRESELATASFGQGVAVTPVQMLAAVAAIANDGKLMWPHLVASSRDPSTGATKAVASRVVRQAIAPEAAKQMRAMMVSVVEKGSGSRARMDNFKNRVFGKTGTAEIPENGAYSKDRVIASFVGCMPVEDPKFCVLVIMRKPKPIPDQPFATEGAIAAAPVWKEIAQAILLQQKIN
jgi:cell division protein FtsI/penicillin-binding protein 2